MKNHITNKHLKVIASFVYNVVTYVLAKGQGKEDEPCFDDDLSQIHVQHQHSDTYSEAGHPTINTNDETPKTTRNP